MISLGEMKNIIIVKLYNYSAYNLPNICTSLGLKEGTENEAFNSKKRYVQSRINTFTKEETISLLHSMKEKLDINLIPEEKYSYTISELTKRDVTDLLVNGLDIELEYDMVIKTISLSWHGRISEIDFIKRICKTSMDDKTYKNIKEKYGDCKEMNNYFFESDELPYKNSNTDTFLKILCEMFHPAVRDENGHWKEFKKAISKLIKEDGFEFYVSDYMSGREIYNYRKITFLDFNEKININNLMKVSEEINSEYISKQIQLMEQNQKENPTESIGKAKELLEAVCKTILNRLNEKYEENWDIQKLTKETYKVLKLSPDEVADAQLSQTIKQILGGLNSISGGLAGLRNTYGSGHGKNENFVSLPERYAKLAIGSVSTLVVFLWDTMLYQLDKNNQQFDCK